MDNESAYNAELKIAEDDLANGFIDMNEFNQRIRKIEREARDG